ncbi:DUF4176 domain-containing protein [Ligilactobacillus sp. LYQ60]|uniref:DUF4176 domain-containing protein n=1 Tax=Ligilactobacillus sp. LYQ60 TaxID=3378799 RepID=UPI00385398C2
MNYLTIGSVVELRHEDVQVMIIGRGIVYSQHGNKDLYDYRGCIYPYGFTQKSDILFNSNDITKILFMGYQSPLEDDVQDKLLAARKKFLADRNKKGVATKSKDPMQRLLAEKGMD